MIHANEGKNVIDLALATTNATALHSVDMDTKGADYLNLYVFCGSHDSATEGIESITVYESDTVTQATNMDEIASISSAESTSTAASNLLPLAAVMALGGVVNEIQIDLKKRKRYIGLASKTGAIAAGMPYGVLARFTRNEQSKDTATQKAGLDLGATDVIGCMAVLTA